MKKAVIVLVIAMVIAGISLWVFGRPAYRHFKERRFMSRAREYLGKDDFANATMSARLAWGLNRSNLEACLILAKAADLAGSPSAVDWRREAAGLSPTVENKLQLAASALRLKAAPYEMAGQILDELAGSAKGVAAYQVLSGELAYKLNNLEQAAKHFEEASRLEPTNQLLRLDAAELELESSNRTAASSARGVLMELCGNTNLRPYALRWLTADSVRKEDWSSAEGYSRQLLEDPRHGMEDGVQHLGILQREKSPGFRAFLTESQSRVGTNAQDVGTIATWMAGHGLADEAIGWLTNRSAAAQTEQPVPLAMVDCYMAKKDWLGLESYLEEQKWGDLEYLRSAFLSRAATERKHIVAARACWRTALTQAGDRLGALMELLGLAGNWKEADNREDALWQIGQRIPGQRWALRDLYGICATNRDTLGLNKLFGLACNYDPGNFTNENNYTATSLLLKLNMTRAHQMAQEMYREHPGEAIVVSTYAYSLHLQGRTAEGLAALEKLAPGTREDPSVALYYGVLLSAAGRGNEAERYLKIAEGTDLLPEEKALLADARRTRANAKR